MAAVVKRVVNHLRARGMAACIGDALEDGSKVVCFARVHVSKRSSGRLVSILRNIKETVKETATGKDERIFLALQQTDGSVDLVLLYPDAKLANDEAAQKPRSSSFLDAAVDAEFHRGLSTTLPKLSQVDVQMKDDGIYILTLKGPVVETLHFELSFLWSGSERAKQWFKQQAGRATFPDATPT
eukprot:CAMPEP_0119377834 /NCGR_PEP_ID=MMETSP1334-20130426/46857_1 /TAXON_ID=127549 /ORGANISM="Calcidiscus leptoporus, Strain RCC1130" /LENGTH=183 /DNA_ID=CAMNT_0007396869 /DNA_START=11 /DNA_END=562 /DNA_ORIENTATION=+